MRVWISEDGAEWEYADMKIRVSGGPCLHF